VLDAVVTDAWGDGQVLYRKDKIGARANMRTIQLRDDLHYRRPVTFCMYLVLFSMKLIPKVI
jgi:hypothetical protein